MEAHDGKLAHSVLKQVLSRCSKNCKTSYLNRKDRLIDLKTFFVEYPFCVISVAVLAAVVQRRLRGEKFTFQNPLRLINGGKFVPAEPVK